MRKRELGQWRVRGAKAVEIPEPTIEELEQHIDELETELAFQNEWISDLLEIAKHHAKDASGLKADIEAAKQKRIEARVEGTETQRQRGAERNDWFNANKDAAMAKHDRDRLQAAGYLHVKMEKWASGIKGQKAWSLSTIFQRL